SGGTAVSAVGGVAMTDRRGAGPTDAGPTPPGPHADPPPPSPPTAGPTTRRNRTAGGSGRARGESARPPPRLVALASGRSRATRRLLNLVVRPCGGVSMAEADSLRDHLDPSAALDGRTRFYSEAVRAVIRTIRCGVLFVMAFWSGSARLVFAELKRVLEGVDP